MHVLIPNLVNQYHNYDIHIIVVTVGKHSGEMEALIWYWWQFQI